jgi:hypothetical protein
MTVWDKALAHSTLAASKAARATNFDDGTFAMVESGRWRNVCYGWKADIRKLIPWLFSAHTTDCLI